MNYGGYTELCNEYGIKQKYKDKEKYYFVYAFEDEDYEFGVSGICVDYDNDKISVDTWISNHKNNDKRFIYIVVVQTNKDIFGSSTSKVLI